MELTSDYVTLCGRLLVHTRGPIGDVIVVSVAAR